MVVPLIGEQGLSGALDRTPVNGSRYRLAMK
jgi:hypothetical protein